MKKSKKKLSKSLNSISYKHYFLDSIVTPNEPTKILIIGAGGNGAPIITGLARMNAALTALGHPGIHIDAVDHDTVSITNIGRQLYSKSDIRRNKAECIITRINTFFGLSWSAHPTKFSETHIEKIRNKHQIIITAVDNVPTRKLIYKAIKGTPIYWLDMGNGKSTGQIILGTGDYIKQPSKIKNCIGRLPTVLDLYPNLERIENDKDQGPSCSLAEALQKQDLFINTAVSTFALDLLWKGFRQGYIEYHGAYINLDTFKTLPLTIKKMHTWRITHESRGA